MRYDRSMTACAAGCLLLVWTTDASGAGQEVFGRYTVTWSGVEIGQMTASLHQTPDHYRFDYHVESAGVLDWFVSYRGQGFSEGSWNGIEAKPARFLGQSSWSDGTNDWSVLFDDDGRASEVSINGEEQAGREPVPAELKRGPDPLALMLTAMRAGINESPMTGQSFDGKRAIAADLDCGSKEPVTLPLLTGLGHKSDSLVCEIDAELLAGGLKKYQDNKIRESSEPPARVWLSSEVDDGMWWPVQLEASTRFGIVTARLIEIDQSKAAVN